MTDLPLTGCGLPTGMFGAADTCGSMAYGERVICSKCLRSALESLYAALLRGIITGAAYRGEPGPAPPMPSTEVEWQCHWAFYRHAVHQRDTERRRADDLLAYVRERDEQERADREHEEYHRGEQARHG